MSPIALIHNTADHLTVMSARNLDIEIHGGDLVLYNGYEEVRLPTASLMTVEIRGSDWRLQLHRLAFSWGLSRTCPCPCVVCAGGLHPSWHCRVASSRCAAAGGRR